MTISDVSYAPALGVGAGSGIGRWVAHQLARPRTGVDPAPAGGSRRVDPDASTPVLASIDLTTVHAAQQPIDRPTPPVGIREVLTAWRAAERELDVLPEGSPEWPDVHARLVGLRASYHQLFNESRDRRPGVEDRWRDGGRPVMAVGNQLLEAR